jgi:hypothetical protein
MSVETKVEQLESLTVDVLMEYLKSRRPTRGMIDKARVAQSAFASVQRRKSAENQRDALSYMMQKEGLAPMFNPAISATSVGTASPSKSVRAD